MPACLEILYEQTSQESTIIIVHCRSNKGREEQTDKIPFPHLTHVRKCCPYGTVFDKSTKICVPWPGNSESFITFLRPNESHKDVKIVATEGPPRCDGAIVDYEINENDLSLQNNIYSVSKLSDISSQITLKSNLLQLGIS